jgi:fructokinase
MFTYLGIAGKINELDIKEKTLQESDMIFLEGYLWDEGEPQKAFNKAIKYSNKVAMTLSDKFCVDRHRVNFLELVKNKLDITFANEQEMISLIEAKNFQDVVTFAKQIKKLIVITRGEKGAIAIFGEKTIEVDVKKNLNIIDLTGAGDLFAAGFLHGYINGLQTKDSLEKGTELSSKIIQKMGARL